MTWADGQPLTKDETSELRRLNGKHRDIRKHGAEVLAALAVKKELQERRQAFVDKHGLACFKCGGTVCEWAAGDKGGRWVICMSCVRKPR
jgi:hypothetical protein